MQEGEGKRRGGALPTGSLGEGPAAEEPRDVILWPRPVREHVVGNLGSAAGVVPQLRWPRKVGEQGKGGRGGGVEGGSRKGAEGVSPGKGRDRADAGP